MTKKGAQDMACRPTEAEMKRFFLVTVLVMLAFVGCRYERPLTGEQSLPVDPAVLGVWEPFPGEGEERVEDERMVILAYTDTDYLIHYPAKNDEMYYRGYPIEVGGVSCVQVQVIGTDKGPLERDQRKRFHVVSYDLSDGVLEVRTLNTDLVKEGLKTPESLREAFLRHKEDEDLFVHPARFRKGQGG